MAQEYLKVGKPDTKVDAPSHTPGVNAGNDPGGIEQDPGMEYTGERGAGKPTARSTARMATSINAEKRNPIDPSMPNMPPA
jgi:hypothetical protein